MSLVQQWAIVFAIFWAASVWYAYSLGHIRGRARALKWVIDIRSAPVFKHSTELMRDLERTFTDRAAI
jgi:hypothetical protein